MVTHRVLIHISRGEHRVLDPADVYYLQAMGGETEVRLRSRTPLLDGSPAIDGALNQSCPVLDQRGFVRWDGACDVGSFEAGAEDPAIFADGF